MKKIKLNRKQRFTIVEVLVAMAVFSILMLLIMQIFGSMQNVWTTTANRTETYQNARVIMDMIATDLQSAFYNLDADAETSWCYYQTALEPNSDSKPIWFVTHRQKSVQAKNSSLVQTGYWMEEVTKDGVTLYALKNLVISNMNIDGAGNTADLYDYLYTTAKAPAAKLRSVDSDLKKFAVTLDDNVVSLKITPFVKKTDPANGKNTWDTSVPCNRLPLYVKVELEILDDDPETRARYSEASADDKKALVRKFSRVIEINRGQYYE